MKDINRKKIKKVLFTGDVLRIDENPNFKLINTQLINIEWIFALFSQKIKNNFGIEPNIISGNEYGDTFSRIELYKELSLLMNVDSWAKIFEGNYGTKVIEKYLIKFFHDAFIVGFELPPYMINFFIKYDLPYIDMTIHPIRYLPDYILGVRSNIEIIRNKLESTAFNENLFVEFADISKALTTRKYRNNLPEPSSALFLGQTTVDASLIYNGKMTGLREIRETLLNLSLKYENVYFKAHPHSKIVPTLKKLVDSISNVSWYEVNIYDALAIDRFDLITSLSSGTLYEANFFGQKTVKVLPTIEKFDLSCKEENKNKLYYPACPQIFASEYWQYLLGDSNKFIAEFPRSWEGALKSTISMKWGK